MWSEAVKDLSVEFSNVTPSWTLSDIALSSAMVQIVSWSAAEAQQIQHQAAQVLEHGGVVAFPTETVYGLAILGDRPDLQEHLFAIKGRPAIKPIAYYVRALDDVPLPLARIPHTARKLAGAFWPGPLTLVFETSPGSRDGFRCSSHPLLDGWISRTHGRILGTSANKSGAPPLESAIEIAAAFGDDVALIIDGGPARGRPASTVVLCDDTSLEIARAGSVTEALIRDEVRFRVVFVCTGNTCRSPMAAAILRHRFEEAGIDVSQADVVSAGIAATPGEPASTGAMMAMRRRGLFLASHHAKRIDRRLLCRADHVLTLQKHHRESLLGLYPEFGHLVNNLSAEGINDPFGGDSADYAAAASAIDRALDPWVDLFIRQIRAKPS